MVTQVSQSALRIVLVYGEAVLLKIIVEHVVVIILPVRVLIVQELQEIVL